MNVVDQILLIAHLFLIIVSSSMLIFDAELFYKFFMNLFGLFMIATVTYTTYRLVQL